MDNKIQELAEKIYKDGVAKADAEAGQIVANAERSSKVVVEKAEEKAKAIIANATAEAEQIRKQSVTEVKNMVNGAEESLLLKITDLVNSKAVKAAIDETFAKPESLYQVVLEMAKQTLNDNSKGVEITTSDAEALEGYIRSKAKEVLDNGVTIKEVAGKAANFDISPEGADYKINVSKEAFTKYFTEFMRPRMREILFGGEKNA